MPNKPTFLTHLKHITILMTRSLGDRDIALRIFCDGVEWSEEEEELCILVGGLNFVELDMCLPERSINAE